MIKNISPSLIPRFNIDYSTGDSISALRSIRSSINTAAVENKFKGNYISYTNSGRASLYLILKALQLKEKSRIGVPLYTCPSVFDAIVHCGHTPVFLDIEEKNFTLDPAYLEKKVEDLDTLVINHTFGRPEDMDRILGITGDLPVIEDCAHAMLSKYKGELLGTISTAGFFSFRIGKYISAGEGGMITTKDQELARKIEKEIMLLPRPTIRDEIKHIIMTKARATLYHRPWFGLLSLPLGSLIENRVDLMNKYNFKTTRIRRTDLKIFSNKIKNFEEKVEHQRQNSLYMIDLLNKFGIKSPVESPGTYCNYYLFPVLFNDQVQRDKASDWLREKGIDTAKLFSKTPLVAKQHYGYKGDCPNTEEISKKILTLPNYYTINRKEIEKIVFTLGEVLNESVI